MTMTMEPVRADTLPENMRYADDGCEESPSCLNCPLPVCKYDDPGWLKREDRRVRDEEIFRLRKQGVPVPELARQFRVSTRTVHRVIQRGGAPENDNADDDEGPVFSLDELAERTIFQRKAPWPQIRPELQRSGWQWE